MLSVVVLSKNEEGRIKTCLELVKWADEILILDNGSTDNTSEIAQKYGKVINIQTENFSEKRNKGFEETKGDWVLYVDADERVLAPLKEEIIQLTGAGEKSAFAISRKNIIFGEEVSYGPYKKDWVIRLLKRDKFKGWVGAVHEYPKYDGELGYTENSLLHLTHRDIDHVVLKSLEWSKIDANLRVKDNHPKMSGWRFFRIFFSELFNQGIKRQGFFNGSVGIIDAFLQTFSMFITYVRLWQLQQKEDLETKYNNIDKKLLEDGLKA